MTGQLLLVVSVLSFELLVDAPVDTNLVIEHELKRTIWNFAVRSSN